MHQELEKIFLPSLRIIGLSRPQRVGDAMSIGKQWGVFNSQPALMGARPNLWYGAITGMDGAGGMTYTCGQDVPIGTIPKEMACLDLPAGHYARFSTKGHLAEIGLMWRKAQGFMGTPGWQRREGAMLEVYTETFDVITGTGGFAILVPTV